MKNITKVLANVLLFVTAPSFAATYNVNESFTGTFVESDASLLAFSTTYNLNFASLLSGDAALFSASLNTIANGLFDPATGTAACTGTCSLNETLKNGDHIFGSFTFTSLSVGSSVNYSGNSIITGGTGLFAGATGTGTFSGSDTYLTETTGNTSLNVSYSITTPSVSAVPELETYTMLLAGLALIGFSTKRKIIFKSLS